MDYLKAGRKLNPPACVQDCVARYKKESDITGQWVAAATFPDPSAGRKPLNGRYKEYRKWFLEEHGEKGHVAILTLGNSLEPLDILGKRDRGAIPTSKDYPLSKLPLRGVNQ